MRGFCAVMLASTLLVTTAFGAENGGLAPGHPAGVSEAQHSGWTTLGIVTLGVLLVGGAAFLISTDHSQQAIVRFPSGPGVSVPVTTSTSTTTTTTTQ